MEETNFLEKAWSKLKGSPDGAPTKTASEKQKEALLSGKYAANTRAEVPEGDVAKKIEENKGEDAWREQA